MSSYFFFFIISVCLSVSLSLSFSLFSMLVCSRRLCDDVLCLALRFCIVILDDDEIVGVRFLFFFFT